MSKELTNYCVIAIISIVFLIGCLVHLSENDVFSKKRILKFQKLIYVLIFETTVDCLFELLATISKCPIWTLYIVKACELVVNPTLIFLVFDIFYDKKRIKQEPIMEKGRKVIVVTIVANAVLQALSIFGLRVFSIDANRQYNREPLVCVYVVLLLVGVFAMMYGMIKFSGKTQSTMRMTMVSFATILLVSILLRAMFENNNYDFLCMSVAIPFLLIYYSHLTLRVDPLTSLLNRNVYSRAIKSIDYTTIVIMVDANSFKRINDSFGHECGDQTLKQIGHAILEAYGQYAYCYRIGGDEFCIIMKPDIFEKLIEETPHHDAYSMAEKFMERLDVTIQAENEKNKEEGFLEYGISQGYAIYYAESNYPDIKDRMSFDAVLKLADERMYYNKGIYKKANVVTNAPEPDSARVRVVYERSDPKVVSSDLS